MFAPPFRQDNRVIHRPKTAGPSSILKQTRRPPSACPDYLDGRSLSRSKSQLSMRYELEDLNRTPRYHSLKKIPATSQSSVEIQTEEFSDPQPEDSSAPAFDQSTQVDSTFYRRVVDGMQSQQRAKVHSAANLAAPCHFFYGGSQGLQGPPLFRMGHGGSRWRHLRQCTGALGNNIMFLDGVTKEEDCRLYPPHGLPTTSVIYTNLENCFIPHALPPGYRTGSLTVSRRPSFQESPQQYQNMQNQSSYTNQPMGFQSSMVHRKKPISVNQIPF